MVTKFSRDDVLPVWLQEVQDYLEGDDTMPYSDEDDLLNKKATPTYDDDEDDDDDDLDDLDDPDDEDEDDF